jgi:hypothetical protein
MNLVVLEGVEGSGCLKPLVLEGEFEAWRALPEGELEE